MPKPISLPALEILKGMKSATGIRPVDPADYEIVEDTLPPKMVLDEASGRMVPEEQR